MHIAIPTLHPDGSVYAGVAPNSVGPDLSFAVEGAGASVAQGSATDADRAATDPEWQPL
jgi:hypothetical protein